MFYFASYSATTAAIRFSLQLDLRKTRLQRVTG
jgi:hypothetical protein